MKSPGIGTVALLIALSIALAAHHVQGANGTTGKKKELERIKREMREKKREIRKADKKERSVLSDMERIERSIQEGDVELSGQQRRLRDAEAALREIERSNVVMSRDLGRLKTRYRERIRSLYKMGRAGYSVAVLSSDSFTGALKRIKYLDIIVEQDHEIISRYRDALNSLALRQAEISRTRDEIVRRRHAVAGKKDELKTQKRKKSELLSDIRRKKDLYDQTLRELEDSSVSLWAMIKKTEQEKKAAKKLQPQKSAPVVAEAGTGRGRLPWPVAGQLITRFGMQRHPLFGTMVFRRGIEIGTRAGEEVRAVADGNVVFADWYKGYGKLLILEHGPGFYTLYGHLSSFQCAQGDRVVKGQVIGLTGDTGGIRESRLYFEIRRNGEAQDPLNWLAKR